MPKYWKVLALVFSHLAAILADPVAFLRNLHGEMPKGVPCEEISHEHGKSVETPTANQSEESDG